MQVVKFDLADIVICHAALVSGTLDRLCCLVELNFAHRDRTCKYFFAVVHRLIVIVVCGHFLGAAWCNVHSIVVVLTDETVLVLNLACKRTSHWYSVVVSVEIGVGLLLMLKEIIYFLIVLKTAIT